MRWLVTQASIRIDNPVLSAPTVRTGCQQLATAVNNGGLFCVLHSYRKLLNATWEYTIFVNDLNRGAFKCVGFYNKGNWKV